MFLLFLCLFLSFESLHGNPAESVGWSTDFQKNALMRSLQASKVKNETHLYGCFLFALAMRASCAIYSSKTTLSWVSCFRAHLQSPADSRVSVVRASRQHMNTPRAHITWQYMTGKLHDLRCHLANVKVHPELISIEWQLSSSLNVFTNKMSEKSEKLPVNFPQPAMTSSNVLFSQATKRHSAHLTSKCFNIFQKWLKIIALCLSTNLLIVVF